MRTTYEAIHVSDPVAKAQAIEERVLRRKRAAFARLQAEAPDAAAFLRSVADVFGKPDAIAIRFADGSRYDGGTFRNAMDFSDFTSRLPAPLYQRKRKHR